MRSVEAKLTTANLSVGPLLVHFINESEDNMRHAHSEHKESLTTHEKIAVKIANILGNPWTIYVFAALALTSLPGILAQHSIPADVAWLSQTFIQLVSLAVLQTVANLLGRQTEKQSDVQYEVNLSTEKGVERIEQCVKLHNTKLQRIEQLLDTHLKSKKKSG